MSELHAMVEEMAALSALGTNVMNAKYVDTNVTDVDMTDPRNQTDLARAPTIQRFRPGSCWQTVELSTAGGSDASGGIDRET